MDKIFENFTDSVLRLHRLVQRIKVYEMRNYGLSSIHVMCVYYLSESENGLTAGELVRSLFEDKAAVSRALKLLRDKGYVEYESDKYNARIRLTDEGKKVAAYIDEKANKAVEAGSAVLSEGERELFYRSLGSIAENLNNYYNKLISEDRE